MTAVKAITLATKITLFRIFMVPVFIALALYYGESVKKGQPEELFRWAAIIVFVLAAASDALDGYIARRFNQRSRLGSFLDPIADKALMLAAILTLSFTNWGQYLPLWYAALVVGRDIVQVAGAALIGHIAGDIEVIPHWTGKFATFLQILVIGWVFFNLTKPPVQAVAAVAAIFTIYSAALYIRDGLRQLPDHHDDQSHHS